MSDTEEAAAYRSPLGSAKSAWKMNQITSREIPDEKKNKKRSCGEMVKEYNESTSLHGPKYTTEDGSHPIEKFCWCLVVLGMAIFGIYLVVRIIKNWQSNPIITSIDESHFALNKIDFPAVTICPVSKVIPSKLANTVCDMKFYEKIKSGSGDTVSSIMEAALGSFLGMEEFFDVNIGYYNFSSEDIIKTMKKVTPTCKDYIKNCTWNGIKVSCTKIFTIVSTDNGFCCSFNAVPAKANLQDVGSGDSSTAAIEFDSSDYANDYYGEETPSSSGGSTCPQTVLDTNEWTNYCSSRTTTSTTTAKSTTGSGSSSTTTTKKPDTDDTTVKKVKGPGSELGLAFRLDSLQCGWLKTGTFVGTKFYIHNPNAFPEVGTKGMAIGPTTENFVAVTATLTEATEETRRYGNETRKCNFQDERSLKYYLTYSRSNCELERVIDIFDDKCKCRPYYLPGTAGICDTYGIECISNSTVIDAINDENVDLGKICPPACSETVYSASMSSVPLASKLSESSTSQGESLVRVFFQESSIVKLKRDQLYAPEDIISNIGGCLGLCLGFSLVSGIELIYFLTCRWCIRKRRN